MRFLSELRSKNFDCLYRKYLPLDALIPAELKCRPGYGWHILIFLSALWALSDPPDSNARVSDLCVVRKAVNMELRPSRKSREDCGSNKKRAALAETIRVSPALASLALIIQNYTSTVRTSGLL